MSHNEERIDDLVKEVAGMSQRLETTCGAVDKLDAKVDSITETLSKLAICPSPGACVKLAEKVKELSAEMEDIQISRAVIIRGWKAAGIIAVTGSAIATFIYGIWCAVETVVHKKP